MLRSKLKNNFNHNKNETTKIACRKQRNLCTSLFRKAKKAYYSKLKPCIVSDDKLFWKKVKPLFSDKTISKDITLTEKNGIISDKCVVANICNDYFVNAVIRLNTTIGTKYMSYTANIQSRLF